MDKSYTINDHAGKLKDILLLKEGNLFASSEDENIQIYSHLKKKQIGKIQDQKSVTNRIQSSKDYIMLGQQNGQIEIINQKNLETYHSFSFSKFPVIDLDIHKSNCFLLALSQSNRFSIFDLTTC